VNMREEIIKEVMTMKKSIGFLLLGLCVTAA